mgnify:CR=1 FL=1
MNEVSILKMVADKEIAATALEGPFFMDLMQFLRKADEFITDFYKTESGNYAFTYHEKVNESKWFDHWLYAKQCGLKWYVSNTCLDFNEDHTTSSENLFAAMKNYIAICQLLRKNNIGTMALNTAYIVQIQENSKKLPWLKDGIGGYFVVYYNGHQYYYHFEKSSASLLQIEQWGESEYPSYETVNGIGEWIAYKLHTNKIKVLCDIPGKAWIFQKKYLFARHFATEFRREDDGVTMYVSSNTIKNGCVRYKVDIVEEIDRIIKTINSNGFGRGYVLHIKVEDPCFKLQEQPIIERIRKTGCEATIFFK